MAYDYHWAGGPVGPIAPLPWVHNVIDYVIMQISLEKIYIGLPCYGYDWSIDHEEKRAQGLSYYQIMELKKKHGGIIDWDQESETPYYCYKNKDGRHEVWFENVNSILKKVKLLKEFQIRGAVFWRLGLEPVSLWESLVGDQQ
jgi:spore germination protein